MAKLPEQASQAVSAIKQAGVAITMALEVLENLDVGVFHIGKSFEQELLALCRSRGMTAKRERRQCSVDLIVNGHRVQCKQTDGSSGVVRVYGGRKMSYLPNAFDILAVRTKGVMFFIPTKAIPRRNGKLKNSIRISLLRKWRDAWHVFDGKGEGTERMLFSDTEEAG